MPLLHPPHRTETEAPLLFSCRRPLLSPPSTSQAYRLVHVSHFTCPLTTHIPSLVVTSRHVTSSSTAQRQVLNPVTYQVFSPLAIPIFALWNGGSALFFIRLLFRPEKDFVAGLQKMTGMPHHVCLLQDPEPNMSLCPGGWEPIVSR